MNEIHLHTDDIEGLKLHFKDRFGNRIIINGREFGYIMQNSNIVKIVYSREQAEAFLNRYKGQKIEPIYFYFQKTKQGDKK